MKPTAIVIGAGIVGLSTGVCLQERGFNVTIVADKFLGDTTSHKAGGVFLPYNRDVMGVDKRDIAIDVVKRSWRHYSKVYAENSNHTGVMKCFGYQCYFTNQYGEQLQNEPLANDVIPKQRQLQATELKSMLPNDPCTGWVVETFIIQNQFYLPYLARRFQSNGGTFRETVIKNFIEVSPCDVVINCSGLGAAELADDKKVFPARGQLSHIRAPHIKHFFHCEVVGSIPREERQLLYILPQTDHVIIGGTYEEYNSSVLVSDDTQTRIVEKLQHIVPSIKTSQILKEECGIRPARSTIRLETEKVRVGEKKAIKIVHNYGHGGNGVALSWGTAELAAELALKMVIESRL